ncbi:MAG: prenyltransferase/squalene oxidase repeat-containing protein [Solirubrobacterales bacterium]
MKSRKFVSAAVLAAVLLIAITATAGASTNKGAVRKAAKYLDSRSMSAFSYTGFKADAASAIAAARKSGVKLKQARIGRFIDALYESSDYGVTAGETGKLMLAAAAGGKNPRCFGTTQATALDLYALSQTFRKSSGQYGSTAFDHAFAVLGLVASGHKSTAKQAVKFAKSQRGKNGWNFAMSTSRGDDVDSTSLMIEALRAAGVKKSDNALRQAFRWLHNQRNADGGFNPDAAAGETNANSTALAIRAADALGKKTSQAKRALRALQSKDGHFRLTPAAEATSKVLATSDPLIALTGRTYPVVTRKKPGTSCA